MKTTALFADARSREHLVGRQHPERPERFDAVMEGLRRAGLLERGTRLSSRSAEMEELLLVHTPEYLNKARHDIAAGYQSLTTGDTDVTPNSWEIALLAVGGVLNAVDAVATGR